VDGELLGVGSLWPYILASCTIMSLVKKSVHFLMCAGRNRDKEGKNQHLASGLGGKEGATLQFVSSKRLTKRHT